MSEMNFGNLKKRAKDQGETPKKVYKEVEEAPLEEQHTIQAVSTKASTKTRGRASWKEEGIEYVRIGIDVPVSMHKRIKRLLVNVFDDTYSYQDEMLNAALLEYLEKHEGKK
ncbi:MAG: hypothetical protein AAFY76_09840 [Cyanobacteria bacterium J06649_11]